MQPGTDDVNRPTRYEEVDVTEWWCPTKQKWMDCSGPCPDGTVHIRQRVRSVRSRVLNADDAQAWRSGRPR